MVLFYRRKKKGDMKFLVYEILFAVIGFLGLILILNMTASNTDIEGSMAICRASIILGEKSEIGLGDSQDFFSAIEKPLKPICRTFDITMPEVEDYRAYSFDEEGIMRNIGERAADCWKQFGQGTVSKDVFGKTMGLGKRDAFACFTFTIDLKDKIPLTDFITFAETKPYKARTYELPICSDLKYTSSSPDVPECIDEDEPECVKKGGICSKGCQIGSQQEYSVWLCDNSKEKCCVANDNVVSYSEYIQSYLGEGQLLFEEGMTDFDPNEEYGIFFLVDSLFMG